MMQHALLGLTAETSLHAGTGRRTGVIDLPIMREAHTHWPCVYGSAVKGALRSQAQRLGHAWLTEVFGPETDKAHEHAGALTVGDARLLLLPVRSLNSHFKWVTCPALLRRAEADAQRLGITDAKNAEDIKGVLSDDTAVAPHGGGSETQVFLEEFSFSVQRPNLSALVAWLARFGTDEAAFAEQLKAQLMIVSDDMFNHLASFATPVTPHIAIDNARKVVKDGALWYEETLPPDTVLYVALAANRSRAKGSAQSAAWVLEQALSLFPQERPYVQLGGNETVGMGWCRVRTVDSSIKGA